MPNRREHEQEVRSFLEKHLSGHDWGFSLPHGTGAETYVVRGNEQNYFVKVGAPVERYLAMAEISLTPSILAIGQLQSGLSILVQPYIEASNPSRRDYRHRLDEVAALLHKMHHDARVRQVLPPPPSNLYKDAARRAWHHLRQKWERYKIQVPGVARFVDESLECLAAHIDRFSGSGLISSHGDICNANWLFASNGMIYVVDLESMAMEDPALDIGALLWWYYPPDLRRRFFDIAGYCYDDEFKLRMQVRMAMHCLHITLPREQSFDSFDPDDYDEALTDFRAILAGQENPQGYN